MNNTNNDLYNLVELAQAGDQEAMYSIIERFKGLIRKQCKSVNKQDQHDIEQQISEKIIIAVRHYNLEKIPGFWDFCNTYCTNNRVGGRG